MGRPVPTFLDLATTYRCQCRCVHCAADAFPAGGRTELTTSQLKSVIDAASRLGVLEIIFSGGEPLLRKDTAELVRHAHDAGLIIRLNTNGLGLTRERVAELKEAGLNQCGVSIDDADPAVHDRLRGFPGAYEKAVQGIRNLHKFGIFCQILTYASRQNVPAGLEKIIALAKRLDVLAVFVFFPMAVGRWDAAFDQVLTDEERAAVRALQDLSMVHIELPTPRTLCCAHAKDVLYVTAYGDVTPCPFVPYVIGNIRDHALSHVWRRHCAELNLACRGACPMNFPDHRDGLKRHAESVAKSLE